MQTTTSKDTAFTVTVKDGNSIETFFFYDMDKYADIVNAIYQAQAR